MKKSKSVVRKSVGKKSVGKKAAGKKSVGKKAKPAAGMSAVVGFKKDILPLFTATDIAHMKFFCNLSKKQDNQMHAQEILNRLKGQGGRRMPPPPSKAWTAQQIALYQSWINGGFQP